MHFESRFILENLINWYSHISSIHLTGFCSCADNCYALSFHFHGNKSFIIYFVAPQSLFIEIVVFSYLSKVTKPIIYSKEGLKYLLSFPVCNGEPLGNKRILFPHVFINNFIKALLGNSFQ